ncbi:MAG: LamG domain-containing protein, partial [Planctomycetota bacterium]|nr:LamG domain-containing protein [Planctomycetota bacterium]
VQAGEEIISGELEASRAQTDIERESDPSAADVQNIQSARTEAAPRKRRDASRSKPSAQRRSRTVMASMKRKPPVALVGIAAAVILVIGVVWFFSRGPNSKKVSKATTTVPATIPPVIKPPAVTKKGDLLLHLPLDKVAHDVSETKAEVKLIGLGRPGDDRFNSPGDCVFFRPTDGLLIEKPPSLGAEFTVSMWVRYREIAREPWSQIVFRSRSGNRPTLSLGLMKLGPKQQMHWTARAKGESTSFAYKHDKARVHRWYHLAVTSKDGNARIYSDGVPGEARRIPELPKPDVIIIGNATGTPKNLGFTGRIDDVRIYNRALSLDELKNLFQERGWPKKTTEQPAGDGLVMHLPFDGDFKDATGNGYDGRGKDVRLGERDRKPQTIAVFNGKSVISQETLPNLKEGVTYALWAKLSSEALPERWGIVMHRLGGAENEIGLGVYPQTRGGEKRLAWSAAIEWQDEGKKGGAFLVTKQSVAAHRWYHLALTL